jgi:hypothetical protein
MAKPSNIKNFTTNNQQKTLVDGVSNIDRRRMLTMTSAAVALPATILANFIPKTQAAPPVPKGDEKLLKLVDELHIINRKQAEYWEAWLALHAKAEQRFPPFPEVTRATQQDLEVFKFPPPADCRKGRRERVKHYTPYMRHELAQLKLSRSTDIPMKKWLAMNKGNPNPSGMILDGVLIRYEAWPEAEQRRDEILAAIDQWLKQCRVIERRMGLRALEKEGERLNKKSYDTLDKIEAQPITTMDGIIAKAKTIAALYREDGSVDFGETTDSRLACQIINVLANDTKLHPAA